MGIEGINEFSSGPTSETTDEAEAPTRPTDQEIRDRQESELAAEREEHNRRRISSDRD